MSKVLTNLPLQLTSFIGREQELADLLRLLPSTRLLTLTGSGGTGKTRLSLELAAAILDQYRDGVWLVELAPLSDPTLVLVTIASALGVHQEQGRPLLATITDWLRPKELLLVLDNCEHLIDACAQFADVALRASPGTRILASSREPLGITGELAWRVPSLPSPDPSKPITVQQLDQYAATRLFIERARYVQPAFALTDLNTPAVAQICYRLDGIPLAIELAAARVNALRVEQIAERLDDRLRLLTTGSRTALPRQQTLRGTIDWSYSLLSEPERTLLRRLAVFAGGWTLETAEAICAGAGLEALDIVDVQSRLVDKSLVLLHNTSARYHMLETIRQYAGEKLREAGEGELLRDRHLAFFLNLAERADAVLQVAHGGEWIPRLEVEHDNLRAALDWACQRDEEQARLLAGQLSTFWFIAEHLNEARTWYERVLQLGDGAAQTRGMALVLTSLGWLESYLLSLKEAEHLLEKSIALWRALDDRSRLAQALPMLCFVKIHQGDSATACALYESNESSLRQFSSPTDLAWALTYWGVAVATARADYAAARKLQEESLALGLKLKARSALFNAYGHLAKLATLQGDFAQAQQYLTESLRWVRQEGSRGLYALVQGQVADVTYLQGSYEEARTLYDEALATFRAIGDKAHATHIAAGTVYVAARQGELEQAEATLGEGLDYYRQGQFELGTARYLAGYAFLRMAQERPGEAVRLLASEAVYSHSRSSHIPIDRIRYERTLAAARAQLGEAEFGAAWEAGRRLTCDEAIALAQSSSPRVPATPKPALAAAAGKPLFGELSAREREVALLVAQGKSNRAIAEELVLSERTVEGHVRNLLAKLGFNSRSQIAVWAVQNGLDKGVSSRPGPRD